MTLRWIFPVLFLAISACQPSAPSSEAAAGTAPAIDSTLLRFEGEIQAYETADRSRRPVSGLVLFVGSSSLRLWTDMAGDLKPLPVLNRGFGGSTFRELNHYFDRLVTPYRPRFVVVYEGDNDIVDPETSPEEVLAELERFGELMEQKVPYARWYMLAVKPSPSRRAILPKAMETNRLIREYCERNPKAGYFDIFTPMLTPEGGIRGELFGPDSLHMNDQGYEVWKQVMLDSLLAAYGR